jgi:capsular polysaccharide transport system permease protein
MKADRSRRRKPTALQVQVRVLLALMLRDMRTRFFGHALGYLIAVAWPLSHILILVAIYSLRGLMVPYGDSLPLYFASGLVPVMAFAYTSRLVMYSVVQNRVLLGFPIVRLFDVMAARSFLEVCASTFMAVCLCVILSAVGIDVRPHDGLMAAKAFGSALLLGVGVGFLNGIIVMRFPFWATGYALVLIVIYITSGVMFVPGTLPQPVQDVIWWNPALHVVEWMRLAYYPSYPVDLLNRAYPISVGLIAFLCALASLKLAPRLLLR